MHFSDGIIGGPMMRIEVGAFDNRPPDHDGIGHAHVLSLLSRRPSPASYADIFADYIHDGPAQRRHASNS